MTDTGERLEKVEGRLANVDGVIAGLRVDVNGLRTDVVGLRTDVVGLRTDVDELRTDVDGLRTDVDGLRTDVVGLRTDVDGLRTDVDGLRTDVKGLTGRVSTLEEETRKLQILGEENKGQTKLIAEVQSHHGTILEQHSRLLSQIAKDIEPLKGLPDFVRTVVQDHERRITALEQRGDQAQ
jgi:archaellum component FlaC